MTPTIDDQGNTYRCGVYSVRQWFEGHGYGVASTTTFAKYAGLADSQQGLAFSQVHDEIAELATEVGASIQWLGDGYLRDFGTFDQSVKDGWCDVVGVLEADIKPGQNYYHYIDVYGLNGANFQIADSFHLYDGEQGSEPVERVHAGIAANWDASLIGLAFRFVQPATPAAPAQPLSRDAQLVTILSVIGDFTYKQPPDLNGIQVLVQQAKHLLGA